MVEKKSIRHFNYSKGGNAISLSKKNRSKSVFFFFFRERGRKQMGVIGNTRETHSQYILSHEKKTLSALSESD